MKANKEKFRYKRHDDALTFIEIVCNLHKHEVMKKSIQKFLALLAIVAILGGMASCKASDCNCPKFNIKEMLK